MKKKNKVYENKTETLDALAPGEDGVIESISSECAIKRRLYDLGFCRGERIVCEMESPLGDPRAYLVRGTLIALRRSDASCVELSAK
ncbi:MAG: ferrous iron transport protein A [Clostridia bacterium]|nr:ferrous iron transport protein A [Clostridia bacterium]